MGALRIDLGQRFKETSSGPSMFMSRLLVALQRNHNVEYTSKNPHLTLGVIFRYKKKGCKDIVRIDGCYYNKAFGGGGMNKVIASSIASADGVIYQSFFSKRLCDKILRIKASKHAIIPNGV